MQSTPEELAYEEALRELHPGTPRHGTWIEALAHSEGEESKARAAYLRFRAKQIIAETSAARIDAVKEKGREVARKAWSGTKVFVRAVPVIVLAFVFGGILIAVIVELTRDKT